MRRKGIKGKNSAVYLHKLHSPPRARKKQKGRHCRNGGRKNAPINNQNKPEGGRSHQREKKASNGEGEKEKTGRGDHEKRQKNSSFEVMSEGRAVPYLSGAKRSRKKTTSPTQRPRRRQGARAPYPVGRSIGEGVITNGEESVSAKGTKGRRDREKGNTSFEEKRWRDVEVDRDA